jgi:lysophospholipase L1-like esterase
MNRRVPEDVTAEANAAIARICEARPRCRFVETEFGPEDFQRDGSHLSPSGYRKWIASLRGAVGP